MESNFQNNLIPKNSSINSFAVGIGMLSSIVIALGVLLSIQNLQVSSFS